MIRHLCLHPVLNAAGLKDFLVFERCFNYKKNNDNLVVENGSTDRASDPIIPLTLALCSRFHQFFLNSSPTFQPEQAEV